MKDNLSSNIRPKNLDFEWKQFCRLGEMIGDGLHHEDPWISKEYKRLLKILVPPTEEEKIWKAQVRKKRNESINKQVAERLEVDKCSCGGDLKQTRSGSTVVVYGCGKKFKYKN